MALNIQDYLTDPFDYLRRLERLERLDRDRIAFGRQQRAGAATAGSKPDRMDLASSPQREPNNPENAA